MKTVLKTPARPAGGARRLEPLPAQAARLRRPRSARSSEYERLGLNPYHHAILALLDEERSRDAGGDRRRARLRPRHARRAARRARGAGARRTQARPGRPPPAPRPDHDRRQAHARASSARCRSASRTSSSRRSTPSSASSCTRCCSCSRSGTSRAALRRRSAASAAREDGPSPSPRARERLADHAVVDARGAVFAAGEDPVAARAEASARQRLGVAAEVEEELAVSRVPEAGGELAGRHDPVAVGLKLPCCTAKKWPTRTRRSGRCGCSRCVPCGRS